jgi:phosphoribosylanthranilate isomerase
MSAPRVKICGITRPEDAAAAVRLGAAAVGFVFWAGSPRRIAPADAMAIGRTLSGGVVRVGVFVDASPAKVADTVREAGLDAVQLHGAEEVSRYASVPARLIKAVRLETADDVERAARLPQQVTLLVDAIDTRRYGGTGRVADWTLARQLSAARPILLAGGISAENIRDAVMQVRPWGVDVSSSVETSPGIKSVDRLTALFATLRDLESVAPPAASLEREET